MADEPDGQTRVVMTLRADFYGYCANYPDLAAHLQDNQVLVGPMREDELRAAIEKPAAKVGLKLQPGLVDAVLADVAREPGALPLLSHALLETFERRRGDRLTLDGYHKSGGVRAAIAKTAEQGSVLSDYQFPFIATDGRLALPPLPPFTSVAASRAT